MTKKKKRKKNIENNFLVILIIFLFISILILPTLGVIIGLSINKNISDNNSNINKTNSKQTADKTKKKETTKNLDKNTTKTIKKSTNTKKNDPPAIATFKTTSNKSLIFKRQIKILLSKNNTILSLPIEEYVKGVVAAEMPANFDIEALKAQAVAARTYAYMCINMNKDGCPYNKSADITDDYRQYQAFLTKAERIKLWPKSTAQEYWNKISKAVESTKGQVIFYKNDIIYAAFHSDSGGKTEDGSFVTGESYPYLKSVKSPDEISDTDFYSKATFTKQDFINKLKLSNQKFTGIPYNKTLNYIKVISETPSKRVGKVKIGNCIFTGSEMRKIFNLKSTYFTLSETADKITFSVKGYGHGMGMSQYGAYSMAKKGYNYYDILKHYYTGVSIERVY